MSEVPGGRVLVVDDDPDVREAVETALELDGHSVSIERDGLAALKRLGQAEFDAVVLDVLMPNLDGFEVCRRLRASGNRTPVLILTARDSEQDTIRGLDLGADDYLVKPFGLGELLARVLAALDESRQAQQQLIADASHELRTPLTAHRSRSGSSRARSGATRFLDATGLTDTWKRPL
jgi:two-component system response regulator MprA